MNPIKSFTAALLALLVLALVPLGAADAQVKISAATPASTLHSEHAL